MPSRSYIRAIDGVLETGLFFGTPEFGKPHDDAVIQAVRLQYAKRAKKEKLQVLVLDKTKARGAIEAGRLQSKNHGYIYASMTSEEIAESILPDYPARPFDENPTSIVSLVNVQNFTVIGNSTAYGREDEFSLRIHETNYDMIVVDAYHGPRPLSKQAVSTLKYKKTGSKRLVLARIHIGTALQYRYYWQDNWRSGSPSWIKAPTQKNPDRFFVEYWKPQWQRIIVGDDDSFLQAIIAQGYDGVVLADADVYDVFEAGGEPEPQ